MRRTSRIFAPLLLLVSATFAQPAETLRGQVRVQTRAEGIVIALDTEADGTIDQVFIAQGVKIAAAFAGPATLNAGDTYIQVIPLDGSPGLQYSVGKQGPTWPSRQGCRAEPALGLIRYWGPVVAVPLAELDSWAIPRLDVEDDRPTEPAKLSALPWFGENRSPYVGQTRILPREGGALIAVDDSKSPDGIADVVLVLKTRETIEPWAGRALVEVTAAGIRVVDLDSKFRVVMAFLPTEIQTRRDPVPLAELDTVEP